jgi:hypothetical protein
MPPSSSTFNWDYYYTSTWYNMLGDSPTDNFFDTYALFVLMREKGNLKKESGGTQFHIPIEYGENTTVTSIGRGGTVSLAHTDVVTSAIYNWKYIVGNVTRYYTDERENKGEHKIIDIAASCMGNLKRSMQKYTNNAQFGDGTGNGGLDPLGLDVICAEDPTAVSSSCGGIPQGTYSWWRNQTTDASARAVETYLLTDMRDTFNDCTYNGEYPDVIISDQASCEKYEDETMEQKQIVNKTLGDAGFQMLSYKGIPMLWDRQCKTNSMYFLNTDYIYWVTNEDSEFDLTPWKTIPNNLDKVAQAVLMGNFATSNRRMNGVLFDIGEAS